MVMEKVSKEHRTEVARTEILSIICRFEEYDISVFQNKKI